MNTHIIQNSGPLVYNGHDITVKAEMLSLTDMWKAAGAEDSRRPSDWLALESTKAFRELVEASLVAGKSGIQVKRGGRGVYRSGCFGS
ncbi:KilA-N domain-containing protein [Daeguia caeni]|uniref:KilA-N domain-containing protein n=1 Tax=Daeguia caeni TaxID=439612 RepID=A0ABV9H5L5_9HYPH